MLVLFYGGPDTHESRAMFWNAMKCLHNPASERETELAMAQTSLSMDSKATESRASLQKMTSLPSCLCLFQGCVFMCFCPFVLLLGLFSNEDCSYSKSWCYSQSFVWFSGLEGRGLGLFFAGKKTGHGRQLNSSALPFLHHQSVSACIVTSVQLQTVPRSWLAYESLYLSKGTRPLSVSLHYQPTYICLSGGSGDSRQASTL